MATCARNPEPLRMIDVEGSFGVTVTFRGIRIRSEVEISGAGNHGTDDTRTRPVIGRRAGAGAPPRKRERGADNSEAGKAHSFAKCEGQPRERRDGCPLNLMRLLHLAEVSVT